MVVGPHPPWIYPADRYYYDWYEQFPDEGIEALPGDREIKSTIVRRLQENTYTHDEKITVDVKHRVVVLSGDVSSARTKRAAGDDAWDTWGVLDVSNQLVVLPQT